MRLLVEESVEVVVVEAPVEWSGGVVVTVLERAEPFGEDVEVGESSGVSSLRWTTDK
jgi:hypothetical protein